MRENLYHPLKATLMDKFDQYFMQVLAMEIPLVHRENIHLRELYMKLYLTLPYEERENAKDAKDAKDAKEKDGSWLLERLKYSNVIYLFNLTSMHLKRMDHLKLDDVEEDIGIAI